MNEKTYNIKVVPNAKENKLVEQSDNFLKIKLTAQPEKGKANKQLVDFLSQHFKIPKYNIEILAGHTARVKIVKICF